MTASSDSARIEELAQEVAPDVLRYFERRVLPIDDAADLVSETLLVVFRRADAVPLAGEEARMWVFGVAKKMLARHRRGVLRSSALAERLRQEISARVDPNDDPEQIAEREPLTKALAQLSSLDREIVALVAWDGFSLADVARHLHMREGTVRSRYSRTRARLRASLLDLAIAIER